MTARRRAIELSIGEEDLARLLSIARSRTEPASRVERARMLLAYRKDPSFFAVGHSLGVHHQTVQRCVERAPGYGPLLSGVDLGALWRCRRDPADRDDAVSSAQPVCGGQALRLLDRRELPPSLRDARLEQHPVQS